MTNSSCELVLPFNPKVSDVEERHSTYIANCVFNSFLSFTAILLNMITIHAIRKTSSFPKPLRTLLLSLAVSDLGVGLLVHPFYTALLVKWLQQSIPNCTTYKVIFFIALLFSVASFFVVVAVTVDRFLAIHLHLRYQELVTHKRVLAVTISIWVLSALISLISLWLSPVIRVLFLGIPAIGCFLLTVVVYIRIYLVVRHHNNEIQALQVQQADEMTNLLTSLKQQSVYSMYISCFCFVIYHTLSLWRP